MISSIHQNYNFNQIQITNTNSIYSSPNLPDNPQNDMLREFICSQILSNNFLPTPSSIAIPPPQIENNDRQNVGEENRNKFDLQFITNNDEQENESQNIEENTNQENHDFPNTHAFTQNTNESTQIFNPLLSEMQPIISTQYIQPPKNQVNQRLIEEIQRLQKENTSLKSQLNQKNEELEKEKGKREKATESIPPIFLPSQGRQAGNFNYFFKYNPNLADTEFNAKNSILTKLSEQFALFFGRTPTDVLGKPMASFLPPFPEQVIIQKSLVNKIFFFFLYFI